MIESINITNVRQIFHCKFKVSRKRKIERLIGTRKYEQRYVFEVRNNYAMTKHGSFLQLPLCIGASNAQERGCRNFNKVHVFLLLCCARLTSRKIIRNPSSKVHVAGLSKPAAIVTVADSSQLMCLCVQRRQEYKRCKYRFQEKEKDESKSDRCIFRVSVFDHEEDITQFVQ